MGWQEACRTNSWIREVESAGFAPEMGHYAHANDSRWGTAWESSRLPTSGLFLGFAWSYQTSHTANWT